MKVQKLHWRGRGRRVRSPRSSLATVKSLRLAWTRGDSTAGGNKRKASQNKQLPPHPQALRRDHKITHHPDFKKDFFFKAVSQNVTKRAYKVVSVLKSSKELCAREADPVSSNLDTRHCFDLLKVMESRS